MHTSNNTNIVLLALRMLKRDWHSGHLRTLLIALLVAVTTDTTIGFLSNRIHNAMELQASSLLGGDLVLQSPTPVPDGWLHKAEQLQLTSATTVEFSSVVFAGDAMLLSAIKAVSEHYPLRNNLKISDGPFEPEYAISHGPNPGKVWVEQRLLSELNAQIGETLEIGDATFQIEKVLNYEPDRSGNFYSFVPRVMMHWQDVAATQVIQPGSRLDYYLQCSGNGDSINAFKAWLTPQLQPGQRILAIDSQQRTVSSALDRAAGYLQLASLMAILLAGVAIAMGAHFFSRQHFDTAALLRCFGLTAKQIIRLFLVQLLTLALLTGLVGGMLGWLLHFVATTLLAALLPAETPLPSWTPLFSGIGLAVILLLGFALPALTQLQRTPPLRVLRRDLAPIPLPRQLSYLLTLLLVFLLMVVYVGNPQLIAAIAIGSVCAGVLTLLLSALFMQLLKVLGRISPTAIQAGLRNVGRRQTGTHIQLLGFGLTGMAMLMVMLVRTELISTWENQLPEQAPNHFVLNILPDDTAKFTQFLQEQHIASQPLYPMIRGRLSHINGQPVRQAVSKENPAQGELDAPEALNRELNLSFAAELPSDNRLLAGKWWSQLPQQTEKQVSIEQRLAEKLHVTINDELTFFVANQTFTARISSIRSVKWESFQPNFYMLFRPGDLDDLPATYLTSFYLPPEQKSVLKAMVQTFPAISVLEVDAILAKVKAILAQVSAAVEFILLFVLAAGISITLATLITTMPERLREGALMRTLGATSRQLRLQQWTEFFAIGLLSGAVAASGAELARFGLYWKFFNLPYTPAGWIWIIVPPLMGLLLGIAGLWSSRKILGQSPLIVLRDS